MWAGWRRSQVKAPQLPAWRMGGWVEIGHDSSFHRGQVEEVVSTGREKSKPFSRGRISKPWVDVVVSKGSSQSDLRNELGVGSLGPATYKELAEAKGFKREGSTVRPQRARDKG